MMAMSPNKSIIAASDQILSHVHRQRERLQNEIVAVTIDDHARQTVAFAPHNAPQFWIDTSPVAIFGSLRDAALEEIQIEILSSSRKTARDNLRFRIVNRAPNQMIAAILERNHVAVDRISENLQDFAGKHPIVSVQNSRARFDDDSSHKSKAQLVCHSERSRERSGLRSRCMDGKAEG